MKPLALLLAISLAASWTPSAAAMPQTSTAQVSPSEASYLAVPSPIRYGGTYHVESGTWTRSGGTPPAGLGPDVIYSNTAQIGYFTTAGTSGGFASGSTNFDEGGVPGLTNMQPFAGVPAYDSYTVNCVRIGYCDQGAPGSGGFELSFYNGYSPCTFNPAADASVLAPGLPAGGSCWFIDLDLSGGQEFCLFPDGGDNVWNDDPLVDSFGWSFTYAGTPGNVAGMVIAGDPIATDPGFAVTGQFTGSNTFYGATLCPGVGTGYITQDVWWLEDPTGVDSNCYFFGGYANTGGGCGGSIQPLSSFYLELAADLSVVCEPACLCSEFCTSNPNSTGQTSQMVLTGSPVASNNNLTMTATLSPDSFGFFITSLTPGFVANPGGSEGNLCLSGGIGRFVGPGQIKNSGSAGEIALSTQAGEFSLTALPGPMGSYPATPGITSYFQLWHRDTASSGAATSNFTSGVVVTWQ